MSDGSQGRNIYLDDVESVSNYLTDPAVSSNNITSGNNRYFQYRAILSTADTNVSPSLSEVTINRLDTPTDVSATDGTYGDKVTVTWTKSTDATGYRVYRDGVNVSGDLGDVATYDDTGADPPTISPGTISAQAVLHESNVLLTSTDASIIAGTIHTYMVVAFDSGGVSYDSATDTGYRDEDDSAITYPWQRSAADSDADYSDISSGTTNPYTDTEGPIDGTGRYYHCVLSAPDASSATTDAVRVGNQGEVYFNGNVYLRKNVYFK
jgi:hypothetical protein